MTAPQPPTTARGAERPQAVVLGASIAGLAATAALRTSHDVTVIERDHLPLVPEPRPGVAQGPHVHMLLAAGAQALEELVPGFWEAMVDAGAVSLPTDRARLSFNGFHLASPPGDRRILAASRPFLEHHLRRLVVEHPHVRLLQGRTALHPLTDPSTGRVTGVRVEDEDAACERDHLAEVVVDATGRSSPTPRWLQAMGHRPVPTEEHRVDVRYTTRHYHLPRDVLDGTGLIAIGPQRSNARGAVLMAIEEQRWMLTLYGFAEAGRDLRVETFKDPPGGPATSSLRAVLEEAQPLDEPRPYRFASDRRRRFERLPEVPEGLLVVGDAACRFNPIYGQGMTVAALQAVRLQRALQRGQMPSARSWNRQVARIVDPAWQLAVTGDLALDAVPGRPSVAGRARTAYVQMVHAAATQDPVLTDRFLRVSGLVDPPTALLRPSAVLRVARGTVRSRRTTRNATTTG